MAPTFCSYWCHRVSYKMLGGIHAERWKEKSQENGEFLTLSGCDVTLDFLFLYLTVTLEWACPRYLVQLSTMRPFKTTPGHVLQNPGPMMLTP